VNDDGGINVELKEDLRLKAPQKNKLKAVSMRDINDLRDELEFNNVDDDGVVDNELKDDFRLKIPQKNKLKKLSEKDAHEIGEKLESKN